MNMDFLDKYDVCQMLHISERTLARLSQKGIIQVYRLEGCAKNFYKKKQIMDMIKAQNLVNRIENRKNP